MDSASSTTPNPTQHQQYPCPQCGGKLEFNPGSQSLKCASCDHVERIEMGAARAVEHNLNEALRGGVGRGYGVERKSLHCEECGATTTFDSASTALRCSFCDSAKVITEALPDDVVRPETLIPFQLDRNKALEAFKGWLASRWFRPNDLAKAWQVGRLTGVYIPYWTFDASTFSRWAAEAGYYYYTTETYTTTENGQTVTRTRQVQHVRWEPAWGTLNADFDDTLVCASKGVLEHHARGIEPFELGRLVAYSPQFLSGWGAERYQIDLKDAWKHGRQRMQQEVEAQCARQVPGDTHRNLRVSTDYSNMTFKHLLAPVWIASYHYQGKAYQFLVNGQTGKVSGDAPWSWVKIALAVITLVVVAYVVYVLKGSSH